MGAVLKIIIAILIAGFAYQIYELNRTPPLPRLEDTWWGPGAPKKEDKTVKPFKINVSNEVLEDLKYRLEHSRPFTPPLENVAHQYGLNTRLLKKAVDYWRTQYDWRQREKFLNKYPQFQVNVQGLKIHYIHVKPSETKGVNVLPLLMLHGWPGSVREFYEIIPKLTTPQKGRKFIFELIVPSLPGYGFSEATAKPGLGAVEMAVLFNNFMQQLGFQKYFIQGGDWGSVITTNMATLFPEQILGLHATMCMTNTALGLTKTVLGSLYPPAVVDEEFRHRMYPLSSFLSNFLLEFGYMHLQATKPDTVGVGLNDSPVGLAAYLLEKFITWTNAEGKNVEDGKLLEKYTYDQLFDNIMIYWVTNSITTSMRLYSESFNKAQFGLQLESIPVTVPSACARFTHDLAYQPSHILRHKYQNLIHDSDPEGGHFAAFEVPDVLAKDIFEAVGKMISLPKATRK